VTESKASDGPATEAAVIAIDHGGAGGFAAVGGEGRPKVDANEVLSEGPYATGAARDLKRLTGLQQAAYFLARTTGVLIAAIIVSVVIFALITAPTPPRLPTGATEAALRADLIAGYDTLSKAHWANSVAVLQPVIWGGLLPVFTLILGYLFGAQVDRKDSD
jgi:hypothetical protein